MKTINHNKTKNYQSYSTEELTHLQPAIKIQLKHIHSVFTAWLKEES